MNRRLEICKVGGSLLNLDDLAMIARLRRWMATRTAPQTIIVTGGGVWADAIRQLDRQVELSDHRAHWLAIRAMGFTSFMLSMLEPTWQRTTVWQRMTETAAEPSAPGMADEQPQGVIIFDPIDYLRDLERTSSVAALPASWDVTSDSIAAHLAASWGGSLTLVKSTRCDASDYVEAADMGFVDRYFPQVARRLERVRIVYWTGSEWHESFLMRDEDLSSH